jgi:hypothetical protein
VRAANWDDATLIEHRAHLQSENGRQAFDRMVAIADMLPGYECASGWHGFIRDFRYVDPASGEWPYAFIVNREDLLFYVRKAGISRVPGGRQAIRERFETFAENTSGEWTVRIGTAADADALCGFLFYARLRPHPTRGSDTAANG